MFYGWRVVAGAFVGMAFKIVDDPFGQLTFMRIYQGTIKKGETYVNQRMDEFWTFLYPATEEANELTFEAMAFGTGTGPAALWNWAERSALSSARSARSTNGST